MPGTIADLITSLPAVTSYSVTGAGNIPSNPTLGAAGTAEVRLGPANSAPGTANTPVIGPNPRIISNALFSGLQQNDAAPPAPRSAEFYVFGQYICLWPVYEGRPEVSSCSGCAPITVID